MRSFFHPLFFTLVRFFGAPVMMPSLIVWLTPYWSMYNCGVGLVFLALCFTDFLDGFIARRHNLVTQWGAHLDPIADKLLIFSTAIALLSVGRFHLFWGILFITRDIFIMGLRTIALIDKVAIPVSRVARVKTCLLMIILFVLIITPLPVSPYFSHAITLSIVSVGLLSVISAILYWRSYIVSVDRKTAADYRQYQ